MRPLVCCLTLLLPTILFAGPPAAEQQALAHAMGDKVQRFEMWTDDDGNVTGLIFINHQTLTESAGERPGITDADLQQLVQFPKLAAVSFEAQPIGDAGLSVLSEFPSLKQVGFHYMAKAEGADASPDFITAIEGMRDLEIIEIKHNFRMKAIHVDKLRTPFPKVWRLVLDTPLTAEQTMHMIRLCPNVTELQLHRTDVTVEQLVEIGRLLPKLAVFWLKPRQGVQSAHLGALRSYSSLRVFSPQVVKRPVTFADGWSSLGALPHLERIEISAAALKLNAEAIKQLQQQRPELAVETRLTRSRNYQGL